MNFHVCNNFEQYIQFVCFTKQMADNTFDIKQTVNRNIEKHQFPAFSNHRSLIGWCTMNYPKVLVNPIYVPKPEHKHRDYDLEHLFQAKPPKEREKLEFVKPFTGAAEDPQNKDKPSTLTLTTTKHNVKAEIFEEANKGAEEYSAVKPLSCVIGPNKQGDFSRKVRQIGEVTYTPSYESEEIRHLKKLPNSILTEQNLMEIMSPKLQFLDLQNNSWISNNLVNKIGYFAPKIKQLILSATGITDDVIIELSRSCQELIAIDISKCKNLTQAGVKKFLQNKPQIHKFSANHNAVSVTDESLSPLQHAADLQGLNINFCVKVTSSTLELLFDKKLKQLSLAGLPQIKGEVIQKLLEQCFPTLTYLDLSFNANPDINNPLMLKVGNCGSLETLILTGCSAITDESIMNLINGEKGKGKPEGFPSMKILKIGGLINFSDSIHNLIRKCPTLDLLQANNLQKLTDVFMDHIRTHPTLSRILINFTPNITDAKLQEIRENNKNLKIIRNIIKMTDPADDGLRMPLPPASLKKKKPKKKKK